MRLRVAFRERATVGEIGALRRRLDARGIVGPTGFYLVEAPASLEGRPSAETLE